MSFRVQDTSLQLASELPALMPRLDRVGKELTKQVVRASVSVTLNLAEANGRDGRDRLQHFKIARGSAYEVQAGLQFAVAFGALKEDDAKNAMTCVEDVLTMLSGLVR